jgi:plasmid stabilization system protein ParE
MTVKISPHAESLFHGILAQIAAALYIEDAYRWHDKILAIVEQLANFPEIGSVIPAECFATVPDNADRLRQTFCLPYRIVYEVVGEEVHVLSIRHSRMQIANDDARWN